MAGKSIQISQDTIFIVNFISIGSGTDHAAKEKLSSYLKEFEEKNKVVLEIEIEPWGKEGETRYVIDLTKLTKEQKQDFTSTVTKMFKENHLVRVSGD